MLKNEEKKYRRAHWGFKGRIKLMKETSLKELEEMFLEMHEMALQQYLDSEKKRFPDKTRKEIIVEMYKLHDKLRGGRNHNEEPL